MISIPESISICEVSIKDINLVMVCQNEDKFYNSTIIIERQIIQDSEGNELFFIEAYEISNEFACYISLLSHNTIQKKIILQQTVNIISKKIIVYLKEQLLL